MDEVERRRQQWMKICNAYGNDYISPVSQTSSTSGIQKNRSSKPKSPERVLPTVITPIIEQVEADILSKKQLSSSTRGVGTSNTRSSTRSTMTRKRKEDVSKTTNRRQTSNTVGTNITNTNTIKIVNSGESPIDTDDLNVEF